MSTVKRQGNFISGTATSDSLKVSSPKVLDDPSGSSDRVDLFQSLSVSLLFANLHIQRVYWFDFPMVFVKIFPRKLYGSAVATSSAPVPGVCPRFVAVMCSTPVPGVSLAFTSSEFQDPVDSHLFRHHGDSFVSRHSTESTGSTSSSESHGASRSCASAEYLVSVHTLLFRNRVDHLVDLSQFGDFVIGFSPSFHGFVEFVALPGRFLVLEMIGEYSLLDLKSELMLIYGSLTRPPESCSTSCLWRKFTNLVCLRPHRASEYLFVDDDVDVLRCLESRISRKQGELWFESFICNPCVYHCQVLQSQYGYDDDGKFYVVADGTFHGFYATKDDAFCADIVTKSIKHGFQRLPDLIVDLLLQLYATEFSFGCMLVAISRRFGTLTTFPFGSLTRPPEDLCFHSPHIRMEFFVSKMKVHCFQFPFILRGSIRDYGLVWFSKPVCTG